MGSAAGTVPELGATFGAAYVGSMVTLAMYGITVLQTWFYFVMYPKDSWGLKSLVASLWVLDTVHVGLVCRVMYWYLIRNFGVQSALAQGTTELFVSVGINVMISIIVQSFFCVRIWRLSGPRTKWWLPALCVITTVLHFGFGMATVVEWAKIKAFSRLHEILQLPVTPFAITAVLSDVSIAGALCGLLWNSRSEFKDTNNLIFTLIIWAINRCLLTSVVAVAETIMFAVLPHDFWFLGIDFVIGKLYANSLLATLNARRSFKGRGSYGSRGSSTRGTSESTRASTGFHVASALSGESTTGAGTGIGAGVYPRLARGRDEPETDIDMSLSPTPAGRRETEIDIELQDASFDWHEK